MGKFSREKGKRGERMWVEMLRSHGFTAQRSQQYRGGKHSFDVFSSGPVGAWEVKDAERPNVREALENALEDAAGNPCAVAWKRRRRRWVVVMDADQLLGLFSEFDLAPLADDPDALEEPSSG